MTHLEFPICSATPSGMMAPWIDRERSNSRILRHRQLTCFNLPSSNCTSVGIPGLLVADFKQLDVAGKPAGWRKSVQFAVRSFPERPIQAHTYIGLDWRGETSSSVPVYMAVSKTVAKSSTYLWSCRQRILTPQTPPQVKKEGPEGKQLKLKQTNGLGVEFNLEQFLIKPYSTIFRQSNASMHCEGVLIKHHLHRPGIRATQNRRQKAKKTASTKLKKNLTTLYITHLYTFIILQNYKLYTIHFQYTLYNQNHLVT